MGVFTVTAPTLTRPNDTTAYASGDLVANSTTAGSVTPLVFDTESGRSSWLHRGLMLSSNATVTNKSYRLFLFGSSPTVSAGDNGAFQVTNANGGSNLIGVLGSTAAISSGTSGSCVNVFTPLDSAGTFLRHYPMVVPSRFWGLLVVMAANTPIAVETFRVSVELEQ